MLNDFSWAKNTARGVRFLLGFDVYLFWAQCEQVLLFWHLPYESVQTIYCYTDLGPAKKPKIIYSISAGPDFLPMPSREHVPFWEGPAPEDGTPRVSGEPSRRKGPAHTSPEEREVRPPARGAPPRRARGVSRPGAINLAEIRYRIPGSGVGNSP